MSTDRTQELTSPKAFISYSWSSPEHQEWVLALATDLEESGIHVVLDKWELREGADKFAFMEKSVTDPSIRKVIVVCDRLYAEKADGRKGGVGTETQIISKEVYEQVDPTDQVQKFVAVITEKDEHDRPYLPTFLKSRIHIDMSTPELRSQNLEQLVRWVYDKPLHRRPERGKPPAYLNDDDRISLGTTARFRHALESLKQNKASAAAAVRDYSEVFAENLESLRLEYKEEPDFDDKVAASIESFLPYRDETVELFLAIARYRADEEMFDALHEFFERLLPYTLWPPDRSSWYSVNADNFTFIIHELFLYAVAALIKHGRFEGVDHLTGRGYYVRPGSPDLKDSHTGMVSFSFFCGDLRSLEIRNQRLQLARTSVHSDLLRERSNRPDLTFEEMMQADFVLYLRDQLHEDRDYPRTWFPYSLLYAAGRERPFELFARAQSVRVFDQMKVLLGITGKDGLAALLEGFRTGDRTGPGYGIRRFRVEKLMNWEQLATRP
jgi:hypothetical protein